MKTNDWLKQADNQLNAAGIDTARLDALVLLEDATKKDRAWLLAHPEFELDSKIATVLQLQIEKRAKHTPLAYIRGKSEFYGREFSVTPDTLQPRSETETMIDLLKNLHLKHMTIADIGTGSGCLAITAALEFKDAKIYATEINQAALKVAQQNAQKLEAKITFFKGNLLEPILELMPEVLLCNLPYVPNGHTINKSAMQEPRVAIFGGEDGLDLYRELFSQLENLKEKPQVILAESLPFQHEELAIIAEKSGYRQKAEEDFVQIFQPAFKH